MFRLCSCSTNDLGAFQRSRERIRRLWRHRQSFSCWYARLYMEIEGANFGEQRSGQSVRRWTKGYVLGRGANFKVSRRIFRHQRMGLPSVAQNGKLTRTHQKIPIAIFLISLVYTLATLSPGTTLPVMEDCWLTALAQPIPRLKSSMLQQSA